MIKDQSKLLFMSNLKILTVYFASSGSSEENFQTVASRVGLNLSFEFWIWIRSRGIDEFEFEFHVCKVNKFDFKYSFFKFDEFQFSIFKVDKFEFKFKN